VPLQNRVTPFGDLIAVPDRGAWMGNRGGCFHTDTRQLSRRRWVSQRWIVCVLEFRGRQRTVMTPGRYTELFFLDEATALAAGHRPCRESATPTTGGSRRRGSAATRQWASLPRQASTPSTQSSTGSGSRPRGRR
jgi:hypothetical protein